MKSMMNAILVTVVIWSLVQGKSSASSRSILELFAPPDQDSTTVDTVTYRLPNNVVPKSYKIKHISDLDGQHFKFRGQSEINISVRKPTKSIKLHAKYLHIDDSIQLKCHPENSSQISNFNVSGKSIDNRTDFLTIFIEEQLMGGFDCNLTLRYNSTYKSSRIREGFYESLYLENDTVKRMASTQFEPIYARRAFPCWDEPALKANFTISIEHNKKYVALSNMHVERNEESSVDPSRTTTHFAESPKMSTYTVAFAIGDFANAIDGDTGKFRVWARKSISHNGQYIQEIGPKLLKLLENYLNFTYEAQGFKKMDIIAIPHFGLNNAMENWGLITWSETIFGANGSNFPMANERQAITAAHELTHQWFGNLVTPTQWSFVWMNEGFATYFGNIITDQFKPEWRLRDRFATEILQAKAFAKDNVQGNHAIIQELSGPIAQKKFFDAISYAKAACVIRMISNVIGEEGFQSRLRQYVKTNAFNSVHPGTLLLSLSDNDQVIFNLMWNWISIPGYPVITVTRDYVVETATVTQWRYLDGHYKSHSEKYFIPLNYVTEGQLDFNNTEFTHFFLPEWSLLPIYNLKRDQFVIFNKQQFGYYRVNYDERNWRMIAKFMRTKNHNDIHVVNRAQLIDDAFHLATSNQLKFNIVLSLIGYLKKETDYVVWYTVWRSIEKSFYHARDSSYAEQFKRYMVDLSEHSVGPLLSVDVPQKDHAMETGRNRFLYWACKMGSMSCRLEASKKFNLWLNTPSENQDALLPQNWVLCEGGRNANLETLDSLWNIYLDRDVSAIFDALACTSKEVFGKYISKTIGNNSHGSEHFSKVFKFLVPHASRETQNFLLDFLIQNYEEIIALDGYSKTQLQSDLKLLAVKLETENQVNKIVTFLKTKDEEMNLLAEDILAEFTTYLEAITERSKEFKEFFEKDIYLESLHTGLGMRNGSMEHMNSTLSVYCINTFISPVDE